MPAKFPFSLTLSLIIAMDYWNAPQWLWGILGTILFIIWVLIIIAFVNEIETDIFKKEKNVDR